LKGCHLSDADLKAVGKLVFLRLAAYLLFALVFTYSVSCTCSHFFGSSSKPNVLQHPSPSIPKFGFYPDIQLHSGWYTEATGKGNFKLRATACFHGKPWFDAVHLEVEPTNKGKLLRLDRGRQFKVPQTIHGYAKVVGIFLHGVDDTSSSDGNASNSDTNEANEVTAHIFVRWLDGMYPGGKANASIFHSAAPVSHEIGHIKDCKAQGNESPYQIFSVDQKAILCPVWLLPDSDKEGEYMAIKNYDRGSWHQYQQSS
jgi:hypothetical protein